MRQPKVGDMVRWHGKCYEIGQIFYMYWNMSWNIEFLDIHGHYHNWKQDYDGGELLYND
jgi:hypothetical protein